MEKTGELAGYMDGGGSAFAPPKVMKVQAGDEAGTFERVSDDKLAKASRRPGKPQVMQTKKLKV